MSKYSKEFTEYQLQKRADFENEIRKHSEDMSIWIQYAEWERSHKEIRKARNVYERALEIDHENVSLWLKYLELEIRDRNGKNVMELLDLADTILPDSSQVWQRCVFLEERVGSIQAVRYIFERWLFRSPDDEVFQLYVNFELKYGEVNRARNIYQRYVDIVPRIRSWIEYARFEQLYGRVNSARNIYKSAVKSCGNEYLNENLFIAIVKYKQFCPSCYETLIDTFKILESNGNMNIILQSYARAMVSVLPRKELQMYRKYINLWINYALLEEFQFENIEMCRQIYKKCLQLVRPKFSVFSKVWLLYAQFEVRQKYLTMGEKTLALACRTEYFKYVVYLLSFNALSTDLDRCKSLCETFLQLDASKCTLWIEFIEKEIAFGDVNRIRGIHELATLQPLHKPELVWKSYIDFEVNEGEVDKARLLYERLYPLIYPSFEEPLNAQTRH